jgi:eukaryotic-like serine/threonine-protein kinase
MDFGSLPVSDVRLVDRACDDFELAWRNGGRPRIEDYMNDAAEPRRSALLRALLASELESRRAGGERPGLEEYLHRFPADAELVNAAFAVGPTVTLDSPPAPVRSTSGGLLARGQSRWLADARRVLAKRMWALPLVAAVILAVAGYWAKTTIENVMRDQVASELLALRDADVEALQLLFAAHEALTSVAANDPRVRKSVHDLLARSDRDSASLLRAPEQADLREALGSWMGQYEYDGFRILDRQGRSIASWRDVTVGGAAAREEIECLDAVFAGQPTVSRPRPSEVLLPDIDGNERFGLPTMFVLAPIVGDDGQVMAALGFRMRPERTFTRVLNVAQFGRTGETFAFDGAGLLLSESRFDDDLKRYGLIPDRPHTRSTLSLELRDPGVDITRGKRPAKRRSDQPLTRLVTEALRGESGVEVDGERDYRGVPVAGAWTWLPEYGFGVITKVDRADAFRPLAILQIAFWSLFTLLVAAASSLFFFTMLVTRLRRRAGAADLIAKQLGRYTLDEKIGEGGMGVVYRAHHAMLRRPTAVKLLRPEKINEKSINRFEREVQLTSQLTHANTITIYDFGRTPEGLFYYAMEYLDGIDLQALVARHGPQPDGRVIRILSQMCASLVEAHGIGLIHRDIKPSNIILTRRGGLFDFVKVVDFGLVKAVDVGTVSAVTTADSIVGTPLYMAPEAIRQPELAEARTDLYAVAAVGYFLLTGRTVFEGSTMADILFQQMSIDPEPPSARGVQGVAPVLEALLLSCLAKDPKKRPESARALAAALEQISASQWSASDAEAWWQAHAPGRLTVAPPSRVPSPAGPTGTVSADRKIRHGSIPQETR